MYPIMVHTLYGPVWGDSLSQVLALPGVFSTRQSTFLLFLFSSQLNSSSSVD